MEDDRLPVRTVAHRLRPIRRGVGQTVVPTIIPVLLAVVAAVWGNVVDANIIPVLVPTGNSTLFQSTTAALFAVLGIFFGPTIGALGGLLRDGSSVVVALIAHPSAVTHAGFPQWLGRRAADIFEDVILGWFPGLMAVRTQRHLSLALTAGLSAWISLPFLVISNTLIAGHPGSVWQALTTAVGDWDEPVDPGLTVYALLTGCAVSLVLAAVATRPTRTLVMAAILGAAAGVMMALGAHT